MPLINHYSTPHTIDGSARLIYTTITIPQGMVIVRDILTHLTDHYTAPPYSARVLPYQWAYDEGQDRYHGYRQLPTNVILDMGSLTLVLGPDRRDHSDPYYRYVGCGPQDGPYGVPTISYGPRYRSLF